MISPASLLNSTHVEIPGFDGPMALLVELIQSEKLNIASVSMEKVTSEYLDRVSKLENTDISNLIEFIQLGSRLNYIKSLSLLPDKAQQVEEITALEHDLTEYQRYRQAANVLQDRLSKTRLWTRGAPHHVEKSKISNVSLDQISSAFVLALKRNKPIGPTSVIRRHLDITTIIQKLTHRLSQAPVELQTIIDECRDRLEIIVTFLALLECIKSQSLVVQQKNQFSTILISQLAEQQQ